MPPSLHLGRKRVQSRLRGPFRHTSLSRLARAAARGVAALLGGGVAKDRRRR